MSYTILSGLFGSESRLKRMRIDFMLSRDMLAEMSGIDELLIYLIEHKMHRPSMDELQSLSNAFVERMNDIRKEIQLDRDYYNWRISALRELEDYDIAI